jgi:hypothetical protein
VNPSLIWQRSKKIRGYGNKTEVKPMGKDAKSEEAKGKDLH